ncbi:MAG: glycosyltransferase family 39 protein [Candidatus Lernaella stagnicola]|nr:glycosyltransferase family 39 protein [Candidatus Lernaella stagnicola]
MRHLTNRHWLLVFAVAVLWRLGLYIAYTPLGLEPDGLGLGVLFWRPDLLHAVVPDWYETLMPKVAGYWPPFYPLLNSLVGRLFDDPLFAGRVVSALSAGGLAVVLGLIVRRVTREPGADLLAALLMATAPLAVFWDTRVRPETLYLLVYSGSLVFAIDYLGGARRARELAWATALAGIAACVKYEAVVLLPALVWLWVAHLRKKTRREWWLVFPALIPLLLALAWMVTHSPDRVGDYRDLFSGMMLRQFPVWFGLSLAALPSVFMWPVAALTAFGYYILFRERSTRPLAFLFSYLLVAHLATIAVGYNWIARYLVTLAPFIIVPAALGWAGLPPVRWLRWGMAILALAASLYVAPQWLGAERDHWAETVLDGRAVAEIVPPAARCWSDDPYLTPYWAGRDLKTLDDLDEVAAGDFVLLNDFYGALRHKRLVEKSLSRLRQRGSVKILADNTQVYTPLAGDVIDPHHLAAAPDLRALGPWTFWQRQVPIGVRTTLLQFEPTH